MTNPDFTAGFAAPAAAQAYDEVLVPRLFTPCADILLTRLGLRPGDVLLDVACGTGTVVRQAAPIIGPTGRVLGRDINEAMVVQARSHDLPPDSAAVEIGVSAAAPLDVGDSVADAVTCQQGLQFFPDPGAAVAEMWRCLRPTGSVAIAVWCGIDRCPLWLAFEAGLAERFGSEHAAGIRQPFTWPGEEALTAVLAGVGFADIRVSAHTIVMHFEGGMRQALRALTATPFAAEIAALDPDEREQFLRTSTRQLGRSTGADDPVDVPARTLVATALRPPSG